MLYDENKHEKLEVKIDYAYDTCEGCLFSSMYKCKLTNHPPCVEQQEDGWHKFFIFVEKE